jgi:PKD repeat protein
VVNASVCNPVCNDAVWGTPFTPNVPGTKTTFDSDDNSAVIAFAGKVGVLWSNQTNGTDYFAIHGDSDSDTTWAGETALSGPDMADDHMNLKTDLSGRVYAVVKTSRSGSTDPLVMLLVRNTSGSWTSTTVGLKRDHHTRAIVELDEVDQIIHVFATSPESGGSIYEKTSPMGSISFPGGQGTVVVQDADGKLNNSTSTKQNVSPATGLVVLASSGQRVYFHQYFSLGGSGGGPPSPAAAFSATPTSGAAPLGVQFTDTSSGGPTAWQWDFQNDGTVDSTQQNPSFVYANPGTYSVKLTVSNASGDDSVTKSSYITVTTAGPTLSFTPTDDAFVRSNHPDENNGSLDTLRSWKGSGQTDSFLKFTVSGVTGAVTSAKLRLYVVQQSPSAGNVFPVADTSWAEGTITWATSPAIGSTRIGQGGPASLGTWIEIDLGSAISGNGTVSLALVGASNTAAWLSSREGANPPQLVLTQS